MNGLDRIQAIAPETGLARSAYEEIRRSILSGDLQGGSLTSVRALSEALGMSRTPVREALVELANDRLVAFERNRACASARQGGTTSRRSLRCGSCWKCRQRVWRLSE